MTTDLIQFREDPAEKQKAIQICSEIGLDLPTYLRMCIARLNREGGIPFSTKVYKEDDTYTKAVKAMEKASKIAKENGISDMSLEEINAEIEKTRKDK